MRVRNLRFRWIGRRDHGLLRLFRVCWERGDPHEAARMARVRAFRAVALDPAPDQPYSVKLSVALSRSFITEPMRIMTLDHLYPQFAQPVASDTREFTFLWVRVCYARSYGGVFP